MLFLFILASAAWVIAVLLLFFVLFCMCLNKRMAIIWGGGAVWVEEDQESGFGDEVDAEMREDSAVWCLQPRKASDAPGHQRAWFVKKADCSK